MGLRAFRTVFVGALAIRRPTGTWDFIILNKSPLEPPRRGESRHAVFQNFNPISPLGNDQEGIQEQNQK